MASLTVGVTGSPNTVQDVSFDVMEGYLNTGLLGILVAFKLKVRIDDTTENEYLVLGQVSSIETINRWHEEAALKNYIKIRGRLPHLTEVGDITQGKIQIIGSYQKTINGYQKARVSVPPGSGIDINMVESGQVMELVKHESGYAFIGKFYGSRDVLAPVYLRHFGSALDGGSGEAYMGGVFGPSGSGKTVMAMTIASLWTAASDKMGFLFLDPQSEFSENKIGGETGYSFDLHKLLIQFSGGRFNPARDVIRLDQVQLEGEDLFAKILESTDSFFKKMGLEKKKSEAINTMESLLREFRVDLSLNFNIVMSMSMHESEDDTFQDVMIQRMANLYAGNTRTTKLSEIRANIADRRTMLEECWNKVALLFSPTLNGNRKTTLLELVKGPLSDGKIKILDLNPEQLNLGDEYKIILMNLVFKRISQYAHIHFKSEKNASNCMVVIDESGEFIPQNADRDNQERNELVNDLVSKVKKLRKYKVGFMFIAQSVAEIQKEIFRNLHYRVYGVGLGIGADRDHIVAKEGQGAFDLYQALPDPRQSGTYSYMVAGILPVLGSSGRPMFVEGLGSDDEIIDANPHFNWQKSNNSQTKLLPKSTENNFSEENIDILD
jgi:hypothetical protein